MTRSGTQSEGRDDYSVVFVHRSQWCEERHGLAFIGPLVEAIIKKVTVSDLEEDKLENRPGR